MAKVDLDHNCPNCGARIVLRVGVFTIDTEAQDRYQLWLDQQPPEYVQLIESMKSTGLLSAFEQAYAGASCAGGKPPKNAPKRLLSFIANAVDYEMPAWLDLAIREYFPVGAVSIIKDNHIAAIFVDDALRLFLPFAFVNKRVSISNGKVKLSDMTGATESMCRWVKTRMGYVPMGATLFYSELKKRSIGEFANTGI